MVNDDMRRHLKRLAVEAGGFLTDEEFLKIVDIFSVAIDRELERYESKEGQKNAE
jgi:hypothetical protein